MPKHKLCILVYSTQIPWEGKKLGIGMFKNNHYKLFLAVLVLDLYSIHVLSLPLYISPFFCISAEKNWSQIIFWIMYAKFPSTLPMTVHCEQASQFLSWLIHPHQAAMWRFCDLARPTQSHSITEQKAPHWTSAYRAKILPLLNYIFHTQLCMKALWSPYWIYACVWNY